MDLGNIVLSAQARFAAKLAGEDADQPGTAQGGVGIEQGKVFLLVEFPQEGSHEVTLAHAVVPVDQTAAVQAEPVLKVFQNLGEALTAVRRFRSVREREVARSPE